MKKKGVALSFWIIGMLLSACSEKPGSQEPAASEEAARWYSAEQVFQGEQLYRKHCLECHLPEAQGTKDWRTPLSDGSYPPPPLDGSAHAWHHPLPALLHTITEGGRPFGGKMPPFGAELGNEEKLAVVAYFQQFWPDDIYRRWEALHKK